MPSSSSRRRGGRAVAVGGDDDPVARRPSSSDRRSAEPVAVADDRAPAATPRPSACRAIPASSRSSRTRPTPPSSVSVSACRRGKRRSGSRAHVRRQRAGEVVLLGEQVVGPVAHPPRLDEHDLAASGSTSVSSRSSSTSHGSQLSMPSKRAPSARRSHCSRPHGSLGDELGGARRARRRSASARGPGRCSTSARSSMLRWSLTLNVGQPVDLVAPQVDADRGVGGRREDVDDRAAPGDLAAVLDELLAAVAELDERARQLVGVDDVAPGGRRSARSSVASGPSRCSSARTPATMIAGRALAGRAAATAPRGAGPSSRRSG